jgi:hypothetical protein
MEGKMDGFVTGPSHSHTDFGFSKGLKMGKQIVNTIVSRAASAADRSRFAALPERYLDDVGLTAGERVAALGYEELTFDPWRVVASDL